MKTYHVVRQQEDVLLVCREGPPSKPLRPIPPGRSLKVRNHSPTGFEFGYSGSGPAQLALAVLLDCLGDELAVRHYQDFKADFLAVAKGNRLDVTEEQILEWVKGRDASMSPPEYEVRKAAGETTYRVRVSDDPARTIVLTTPADATRDEIRRVCAWALWMSKEDRG